MKKEVEYKGKMVAVVTEFHDKYVVKDNNEFVFITKDLKPVEDEPGNALESFLNSNPSIETMKIKQNEEQIKSVLQESTLARESDYALYKLLLVKLSINPTSITANDLLLGMYKGIYPSWESVSRYRRKIQDENPELRGINWAKRHDAQEEVQKELGYIKTPDGAPGTTP